MSTAQAESFADEMDERSLAAVCIPAAAHAFDGFVDWIHADDFPEGLHASWHEGDILLDMSPEEIGSHNRLKTKIYRTLDQIAEEEDLGLFCADGVSFLNKKAKVAAEPDAMFVAWQTLEAGTAWIRYNKAKKPTAIQGSPDLVLELVSDSSEDKDLRRWPLGYHRAGVKEYWIIDARGPEILIEVLKWAKAGFKRIPVLKGCWQSPVFQRQFCLSRTRGRYGFWDYRFVAVDG